MLVQLRKKTIILHILPKLGAGGAEKIHNLLFESLSNEYLQFRVELLDLRTYKYFLKFLFIKKRNSKKIIFGWLYYGGLMSLILSFLIPNSGQIISMHSVVNKNLEGLPVKISRSLISFLMRFKKVRVTYPNEESMKDHIKCGFSKQKSLVIYNGIFLKNYHKIPTIIRQTSTAFSLGVLGRYDRYKNLIHAINAYINFLKTYDLEIKIFIKGKGVDLLSKKIPNNKRYLVNIESDTSNVDKFFREIDVLIIPSLCECSPLVIPEAIFSGKRVISTPTTDAQRLIGKYGTVAHDFQVKSLVSSIKKEYDLYKNNKNNLNPQYFQSMRKHAYKISNLDKMHLEFRKVIEELVK